VRELRRALAGRPGIIALEGLDALSPGAAHDQAAAVLRDAASASPSLTVLASATQVDAARMLLTDAGWPGAPVLDVSEAHTGPILSAASPGAIKTAAPASPAAAPDDPTSTLAPEVHA
jgi:RND superfamily putative drug exporter